MSESLKDPIAPYIIEIRKQGLTYDEAVERILQENGVKTAPVPVIRIAENLGFKVYTSGFKDSGIAGIMADSTTAVAPFKEKRVMVINKNDYATRQNFTIAHEIGHFVLHCNDLKNFFERYKHGLDRGQRPEIENNANAFAAALLMPKKMITKLVEEKKHLSRDKIINLICQNFIVSEKAANRRLIELNL